MKKFEHSGKEMKIKEWVLDEINGQKLAGETFIAEDYWVNLTGKSWQVTVNNPAVFLYASRVIKENLPIDDNVVYGKVGLFGHLFHISEIQ